MSKRNTKKAKKNASKARGSVDTAQTKLIQMNSKRISEIEDQIESKYNIVQNTVNIERYDGTSAATRQQGIYAVDFGALQGVSDTTRVGDRITLKHIDMNYQIRLVVPKPQFPGPPTIDYRSAAQNTVRVIMFWDNQPSSTSTAGTQIVNPVYWSTMLQECQTGATFDVTQFLVQMSEKKWDQKKRFKFVYDHSHTLISSNETTNTLSPTLGLGPRSATGIIKHNINYAGRKMQFNAGGAIPQNRRLYIGFLADTPDDTAVPNVLYVKPQVTFNIRGIYEDV